MYNEDAKLGAVSSEVAQTYIDITLKYVASEKQKWEEQSKWVGDWDQKQFNSIEERITKLLNNYHTHFQEIILPTWTILDVERSFPEWGNSRIDLGIRDEVGPCVLDFKVKLALPSGGEVREVERWRHSGAMFLYTAAYGELHKTVIDRFYIALLVCEPFHFKIFKFPVHPEIMSMWRVSNERVWGEMEKEDLGEQPPWMADVHSDNYGACEFYKACFEHHYDSGLMSQDYVMRKIQPNSIRGA